MAMWSRVLIERRFRFPSSFPCIMMRSNPLASGEDYLPRGLACNEGRGIKSTARGASTGLLFLSSWHSIDNFYFEIDMPEILPVSSSRKLHHKWHPDSENFVCICWSHFFLVGQYNNRTASTVKQVLSLKAKFAYACIRLSRAETRLPTDSLGRNAGKTKVCKLTLPIQSTVPPSSTKLCRNEVVETGQHEYGQDVLLRLVLPARNPSTKRI